ncbi:PREDICTED: protein WVD2-like 7 isoform X2 [Lupinus angustifolius]|uniref:protein WVD2-like 7 isoform X2 n=1 Tax=Lupinus angustifolius TaxID=3871 RepID=UPI00092E5920|nr:PREDICTED: protein WVD2-like 7 isoform X2 [Lupinus angustifolius]
MGDSACLMQPFCYASGITNEANESNTFHALGQSISFGRFMSESMAWEKWSSFSHNRYVEEAERYAKPGSVAQKKAFFEAHYKKLAAQKAAAAAALLEQANNAAAPNNEGEVVDSISTLDSQTSPNSKMIVNEEQDSKVLNLISEDQDTMLKVKTIAHDSNSDIKASNIPETSNNVDEKKMEEKPLIGNSMKVELQNQLEVVDTHKEQIEKLSGTITPQIMTPILKGSTFDQEVSASIGKKKPPVSFSKLLKATGTSKFTSTPVKSTTPISSKRDNITTPMNNNKPSSDKKRYTPKSLQMPNFTPIREINRLTASVMKKFESTRAGAGSSKASKDSLTPLRTPTMASKDMQKYPSLTPLTEKNRNKTSIDLSDSGNRRARSMWRLLSSENKTRSPVISSPFNLRTEERAARRQKKLEEKFNAYEAQKVKLHTKVKEKKETEIMSKLRRSFCFKARPLPDFYKERKASKDETKKDTLPHSESLKEGRKNTPRHNLVESKISLPLNKPSLRYNVNKKFHGNSSDTMIHPMTSYCRMVTNLENTSPNILHGNQNDRNYKY